MATHWRLRMRRPADRIFLIAIVLLAAACEGSGGGKTPCEKYVEYLCGCIDDEEDCEDHNTRYENADWALQDECAAELDDEVQADKESGVACTEPGEG